MSHARIATRDWEIAEIELARPAFGREVGPEEVQRCAAYLRDVHPRLHSGRSKSSETRVRRALYVAQIKQRTARSFPRFEELEARLAEQERITEEQAAAIDALLARIPRATPEIPPVRLQALREIVATAVGLPVDGLYWEHDDDPDSSACHQLVIVVTERGLPELMAIEDTASEVLMTEAGPDEAPSLSVEVRPESRS